MIKIAQKRIYWVISPRDINVKVCKVKYWQMNTELC